MKLRALCLTTVLFGAAFVGVFTGTGTVLADSTLTVGAGNTADYSSIQAAVDNAEPGDTVKVRPGTYKEQVNIDKGITLKSTAGPSKTTIKKDNGQAVIYSTADITGLTIKGFTIKGTGGTYGIYLTNQGSYEDVTLRNNILTGKGRQISAALLWSLDGTITVANNEFTADHDGLNIQGNPSTSTPTDLKVKGNTFSGIGDNGAEFNSIRNLTFKNNKIENYATIESERAAGLEIAEDGDVVGKVTVQNNAITDGPIGIGIYPNADGSGRPLEISGNTLKENGIHVDDKTGRIDTATVLKENTFDEYVLIDRPSSSLLPRIWGNIQTAVNEAKSGDTIKISEGTYQETIEAGVPNLTITGQGPGKTVIVAPDASGAPAVTISPAVSAPAGGNPDLKDTAWYRSTKPKNTDEDVLLRDVVLSDMTVTRTKGTTTEGSGKGVFANHVKNLTVKNLVVKNQDDKGIGIGWSVSPTVTNVETFSQQGTGFTPGDGISFFRTDAGRIEDVIAHDTGDDGIDVQGNNTEIVDVVAYDNPVMGVEAESLQDGTTLLKNVTVYGTSGAEAPDVDAAGYRGVNIDIHSSEATVKIVDSNLSKNAVPGLRIHSKQSESNASVTIKNTRIANNTNNNIKVVGPVDPSLQGNVVQDSTVGVDFGTGIGDVTISGTTFKDNNYHIRDSTGRVDIAATLNQNGNSFDQTAVPFAEGETRTYRGVIAGAIQPAIDAAQNGDVVEVSAGQYDGDVTVDVPNLKLRGPNAGTPGDGERGDEATIQGQVVLSADGTVLNGFTVSPPAATTNQGAEAVRISNTPDGVTVTNNVVTDFADGGLPQWEGLGGIVVFGGKSDDPIENVVITDNKVAKLNGRDTKGGAAGISIQGNVKGATVTGNVVTKVGEKSTAWAFGIVVRGTGNHKKVPQTVTITGNEVTQVTSNPNTATVGVGLGVESDASQVTANYNYITNVELYAENKDGDEAFDASLNYWGAGGPTKNGKVALGGAGTVAYEPFLTARPANVDRDATQQFAYHLHIPRDGDVHSVAFPGPVQGTVSEVIDLRQGETIYAYDAENDEWLSGDEVADRKITSLDAFLVSTNDAKAPIRLTVEYEEATETQTLGGQTVEAGWNFVGSPQNAPPSTALSSTTGEVGEIVHLYTGPDDSPGSFASPVFAIGPGDDNTALNPHAGYWIYMNEGGEIASVVPTGVTASDINSLLKWSD